MKDLGAELAKVTKELNKTKDKKNGPLGVKELEDKGLIAILDGLAKGVELVRSLLEKGEDNCPKVKILRRRRGSSRTRATTTTNGPSRASS